MKTSTEKNWNALKSSKAMKFVWAIAITLCHVTNLRAQAVEKIIHAFDGRIGYDSEGRNPYAAPIQGADGALYGTCLYGGYGVGVVFKVNTDGTGYTVLRAFDGDDGIVPYCRLIQGSDGALYGTTPDGGSPSGGGAVFKLNTDGTGFSIVHAFDKNDPSAPQAPLRGVIQASDGALYGTTQEGTNAIYRVNTDGSGFAVLYIFNSTNSPADDGYASDGLLLQAKDGALYGTTRLGGTYSHGTIFKINTNGTGYEILHNFTGAGGEGDDPGFSLIQGADGALYGTTQFGGGFASGIIFRINTDGTGFTVLYSFDDKGRNTTTLLQLADGYLYGVNGEANSFNGEIFRISTNGTDYLMLYGFQYTVNTNDGANPNGMLIQGTDGALYGTTTGGNPTGGGIVFQLILPSTISIHQTNGSIALSWDAVSNQNYQVQYATDLLQPNWTNLGGLIHATTKSASATDSTAHAQRFYRVELLQ